jgi:hypothetical protein
MYREEYPDPECPLKSIESSCEILDFTEEQCLFSLRYDSCNIESFQCDFVEFNSTEKRYMPSEDCTSQFYDYETWQLIREESKMKIHEEWKEIYKFFEKYHENNDGTCVRSVIDAQCSEFEMFTDQCLITIIYDPCHIDHFVCDFNLITTTNEYHETEDCGGQLRDYEFWSELRREETFQNDKKWVVIYEYLDEYHGFSDCTT